MCDAMTQFLVFQRTPDGLLQLVQEPDDSEDVVFTVILPPETALADAA